MANNTFNYPPIQNPFVDQNGYVTAPWLQWLRSIFQVTGNGGVSNQDIAMAAAYATDSGEDDPGLANEPVFTPSIDEVENTELLGFEPNLDEVFDEIQSVLVDYATTAQAYSIEQIEGAAPLDSPEFTTKQTTTDTKAGKMTCEFLNLSTATTAQCEIKIGCGSGGTDALYLGSYPDDTFSTYLNSDTGGAFQLQMSTTPAISVFPSGGISIGNAYLTDPGTEVVCSMDIKATAGIKVTDGGIVVGNTALPGFGIINVVSSYQVGGDQVVGTRQGAIGDATGGTTVDAEARSALNNVLAALRAHGLIAT